MCKMVLFISLG